MPHNYLLFIFLITTSTAEMSPAIPLPPSRVGYTEYYIFGLDLQNNAYLLPALLDTIKTFESCIPYHQRKKMLE